MCFGYLEGWPISFVPFQPLTFLRGLSSFSASSPIFSYWFDLKLEGGLSIGLLYIPSRLPPPRFDNAVFGYFTPLIIEGEAPGQVDYCGRLPGASVLLRLARVLSIGFLPNISII